MRSALRQDRSNHFKAERKQHCCNQSVRLRGGYQNNVLRQFRTRCVLPATEKIKRLIWKGPHKNLRKRVFPEKGVTSDWPIAKTSDCARRGKELYIAIARRQSWAYGATWDWAERRGGFKSCTGTVKCSREWPLESDWVGQRKWKLLQDRGGIVRDIKSKASWKSSKAQNKTLTISEQWKVNCFCVNWRGSIADNRRPKIIS